MKGRMIVFLAVALIGSASTLIMYPLLFAQITNLSLPTDSGTCLAKGASINMPLTADELTSVMAWDVNVTYTATAVNITGFILGPLFTGSNTFSTSTIRRGTVIVDFSFEGGATVTSASSATMVTFTFKTLVKFATAPFHIVLSSENTYFGTELLGPLPTNVQSYTTTDGFLGCQNSPGP